MTRRWLSIGPLAFASLLVLLVGTAAADPISLTSGSIVYSRDNAAAIISLTGRGVTISGFFGSDSGRYPRYVCISNCIPGNRMNRSETESLTFEPTFSPLALHTADNVFYEPVSFGWQITAGDVVVPNPPPVTYSFFAVPFEFRGGLTGISQEGCDAHLTSLAVARRPSSSGVPSAMSVSQAGS